MSGSGVTGTTPRAVSGEGQAREEAASKWVRGMFGGIARHYDLLNHLPSFNLDKRWRARTVTWGWRCPTTISLTSSRISRAWAATRRTSN